jgi:hypothetical protein
MALHKQLQKILCGFFLAVVLYLEWFFHDSGVYVDPPVLQNGTRARIPYTVLAILGLRNNLEPVNNLLCFSKHYILISWLLL